MDCTNINIKKGSTGTTVQELQIALKDLGFYTAKIDSSFGSLTETAVKQFQKKYNLLTDGIVGPVTCKKINSIISNRNQGIYTNDKLCENSGGNCLGQITSYHCGPHSIKQALRKFGITNYSENTIGKYAGTTTRGTSHGGLETAIAKIAKMEGVTLKVEWLNFSDLGDTQKERFKKYGELTTNKNKVVFHHEKYRDLYGHYSILKLLNINTGIVRVANSLGSKCKSPAFCGYMENRDFNTQNRYYKGISQKSICVITKV